LGFWEWLVCWLAKIFGFTYRQDITVVEDSANDNGYLTGKANKNPGAIRATSKEDMVNKVLRRLYHCACIRKLKIVGHGAPGVISVGAGQSWGDCLEIDGKDDWKTVLRPLQNRFCSNGRIILIGCNVGACEAGRNKLKELADYFGVPVEAPTGKTYGNCSEEEGSVHQIAYPGEPAPPHKSSPSDEKKKKEKPSGVRKFPFKVENIKGIAIYSIRDVPKKLDEIKYKFTTSESILNFVSNIDFSKPINGYGLGARFNAVVYINFDTGIMEYRILSDFDYFMEKDNWEKLYDISWELKQKLRKMIEQ
jgi:hypothetical protein